MDQFIAKQLLVEKQKVTKYLLNPDHPEGRDKARIFMKCGFDSNDWKHFADAIRNHAVKYPVKIEEKNQFGTKLMIEGLLVTPSSKKLLIRSVWMIRLNNEERPVLITAYPISL